jgi:hypothetical protein
MNESDVNAVKTALEEADYRIEPLHDTDAASIFNVLDLSGKYVFTVTLTRSA